MTSAERLAQVLCPASRIDNYTLIHIAQRAIHAGWTPPPDPYEDIARAVCKAAWPVSGGMREERDRVLETARRIPDDLARQVANALQGDEADG